MTPHFSIEYQITEADLDSQYRHVDHTRSFKLLEQGRLAYIAALGFPNEQLMKRGLFLVITRITARYKRELRAEKVSITCYNPTIVEKEISIDQQILNARGKIAIEAVINLMFLDQTIQRGVPPPSDFARAFSALDTGSPPKVA